MEKEVSLSIDALTELREICKEEYGDTLSDLEIQEMGNNLLRIFHTLFIPKQLKNTPYPDLKKSETLALVYITDYLQRRGQSPSVRDITKAMGYRSSRTGHRVIEQLILKGRLEKVEKVTLKVVGQ